MSTVFSQSLKIPVFSGLVFGLHLLINHLLGQTLFAHLLWQAYMVNVLLAMGIVVFLLKAPARFQGSLGFLFMFGSLFKFLVFFILFYPSYHSDGEVSKAEFITFFVPYISSLILETQVLTRVLRLRDK